MTNPDDARQWLAKADSDLLNIENNLRARRIPWDTVCFHAQQAAEKALKAVLVAHGRPVARTHDVVVLLAECGDIDKSLAILEPDCRVLNAFAVMVRYPDALAGPTTEEGRCAAPAPRRVYEHVRRLLP
jgi:HEPN domain-containing protein